MCFLGKTLVVYQRWGERHINMKNVTLWFYIHVNLVNWARTIEMPLLEIWVWAKESSSECMPCFIGFIDIISTTDFPLMLLFK